MEEPGPDGPLPDLAHRQEAADEGFYQEVAAEAEELAAELRRATLSLEAQPLEEVFDTVYAEPHRQVEAEKAWLKDYEAASPRTGRMSSER